MEKLNFKMQSQPAATASPVLVGVTASGNCEVLIEQGQGADCEVNVDTSARGFGPIWQAVVTDFCARWATGGLRIDIHDVGATPAVVSLRLDQAMESRGAAHV